MAITDLMNDLEAKVSYAQEKQEALTDAVAANRIAQEEYTLAVAEVEKLKTELVNVIGNIFTTDSKVRVY